MTLGKRSHSALSGRAGPRFGRHSRRRLASDAPNRVWDFGRNDFRDMAHDPGRGNCTPFGMRNSSTAVRSEKQTRANTDAKPASASRVSSPSHSLAEESDEEHIVRAVKLNSQKRNENFHQSETFFEKRRSQANALSHSSPDEVSATSNEKAGKLSGRKPTSLSDSDCGESEDRVLMELLNEEEPQHAKKFHGHEGETSIRIATDAVDISALLSRQCQELEKRREIVDSKLPARAMKSRGSGSVRDRRNRFSNGQHEKQIPMSEAWMHTLETTISVHPDFFSSDEAKMKVIGNIGRGRTGYSSLKLNETNNSDMSRMFTLTYEAKRNAGQPISSYEQFKVVVGQYARFCCVAGKVDAKNLWKEGQLFSAVADMDSVRAFMQYFQLRGMHTTNTSKAHHLRNLCHAAEIYFTGGDENAAVLRRRVLECAQYLNSVFNAEKTRGRQMSRLRQDVHERIARVAILLPADFVKLQTTATKKMKVVMKLYAAEASKNGDDAACKHLDEKNLISAFCINFQSALMLCGGGQRPQVYTQLLVPSNFDLRSIGTGDDSFFELSAVHEKTTRSLDIPNVLFSSKVANFLKFYVLIIRRFLVNKLGVDESETSRRHLLMDTRTGGMLRSAQLRHTLRAFIEKVEPGLASITPMSLRASYATWMLQRFRAKEIFTGIDEEGFLDILAKQMNTSVEQLRTTYAGIDRDDFKGLAKQLIAAFELNDETGNSDSDKSETDF